MQKIKNIAIIAHVDHGKTTIIDHLLKQTNTFREGSADFSQTLIMDNNDLEKERGITILAKITAILYQDYKINIIDTPGHADFSSEVERVLNMADGVLLLVDAQEGVMPQTRFVLSKAIKLDLKPIVIINKIDKPFSRIKEVEDEIAHLFLETATSDHQLEYETLYAIGREGKAFNSMDEYHSTPSAPPSLTPILDSIITHMPSPKIIEGDNLQMLISELSYDSYQGRYAIGKIYQGSLKKRQNVSLLREGNDNISKEQIDKVFIFDGLGKREIEETVGAGEIVAITGISNAKIGDSLSSIDRPEALKAIELDPPTIKMNMSVNSSPFMGKEGKLITSRQLEERLEKEIETNIGLSLEKNGSSFTLSGRGQLHLSILFETMRREGYEFELSSAQVVTKTDKGMTLEPVEELTIEIDDQFFGAVSAELGQRRAELIEVKSSLQNTKIAIYKITTQAILGLRGNLMTLTKGNAILSSIVIGFEPIKPSPKQMRPGVLIASEAGKSNAYGLNVAQERGRTFIPPGVDVYEGMIVGLNKKNDDMMINVTKAKKLTNVRASGNDDNIILTPPKIYSLEEAIDFIQDDELLEITPANIRLRKKYLKENERKKKN